MKGTTKKAKIPTARQVAVGIYVLIKKTVIANKKKFDKGERLKSGGLPKINALFEYPSKRMRRESKRSTLKKAFWESVKSYLQMSGEITVEIDYSNESDVVMKCFPNFVAIFDKESVAPIMELPVIKISGWLNTHILSKNETIALYYALKKVANESYSGTDVGLINTIRHSKALSDRLWKNMK